METYETMRAEYQCLMRLVDAAEMARDSATAEALYPQIDALGARIDAIKEERRAALSAALVAKMLPPDRFVGTIQAVEHDGTWYTVNRETGTFSEVGIDPGAPARAVEQARAACKTYADLKRFQKQQDEHSADWRKMSRAWNRQITVRS